MCKFENVIMSSGAGCNFKCLYIIKFSNQPIFKLVFAVRNYEKRSIEEDLIVRILLLLSISYPD